MSPTITSTLEFSHIRATEVSKYQELRVRITLDGNIQESLESTLDAGVHTWREPFSFVAHSVSLCEIDVLVKKRKFFCCTGRYKAIRTTRLQCISELLDTRSSNGVVRLPLYDPTRTDANSAAMGSVVFMIASVTNDTLNSRLSTRDSLSYKVESYAGLSRLSSPEEKLSLAESESEVPASPPPRPMAPTPPASPLSPILRPPNVPPQPLLPSPVIPTPQYLRRTAQLPQSRFAYSPKKSGVDRIPAEAQVHGVADVHPKYVPAPGILSDGTMTAISSLAEEDKSSGLAPQGSAEIGQFSPVICEPPEDIDSEGSEAWSSVPPHMTQSTSLPAYPEGEHGFGHGTIPQISITLAKSSRGNSPLAPSTCDSDAAIKRPSVHVDTGSATPGCIDESPFSRSAILPSPQPMTATNTSSSGLSPFSRTSIVESPSTAATTPARSATSEAPKDALTSTPGSPTRQRKERPTIDTSCVGPRGQVRKYRNGSVPPVNVPVKLRNASLDLPRTHEHERFEPNPSMYSIAPSVSPYKKSGDLRCPSTQPPTSRQGLAPSTRAQSFRKELEYDEAQICLDTASLGDQEVTTFLKEVDAALSSFVNGSPAVAADSRAFLAVPSRLSSRNQSRRPSQQQLRADLSATVRSRDREGATRAGFSLVATSHPSPHPDVMSSRAASPLSGQREVVQRMFLSQVDVPPGSLPVSPSRSAMHGSASPFPQRVSPQPSPRHERVEWVSPAFLSSVSTRTREQLSRAGSYYGDVNGNENTSEVFKLEIPPQAVRGRPS